MSVAASFSVAAQPTRLSQCERKLGRGNLPLFGRSLAATPAGPQPHQEAVDYQHDAGRGQKHGLRKPGDDSGPEAPAEGPPLGGRYTAPIAGRKIRRGPASGSQRMAAG